MIRLVGVLAAAALVLALGGCSASGDSEAGEGPARVYVSLPLRGATAADGRDAADGARLALSDAGGRAGQREIRAVFLDDTERIGGVVRWSPARVGANARRATRDSTALAYIGDFESGATRTSLPITNEARMLQVSPASAANDLVVEPETFDDVPSVQPSGERSFARVIPSDEAQAEAGARWARELGARRVLTVSGDSEFGRVMARSFTETAQELGLRVTVAQKQLAASDFAYAPAFSPPPREHPCARVADLIPGPESMFSDAALSGDVSCLNGAYITSSALDPSHLPDAGKDFARRFRDEHGHAPGRYAAYGYEAMAVARDAIERAGEGADRSDVIDAFFDVTERESVLGRYSITRLGDTTLGRLSGYRVENGRARAVAELP